MQIIAVWKKQFPVFHAMFLAKLNGTDRLCEMRTKGGGGSKLPKFVRIYLMEAPKLYSWDASDWNHTTLAWIITQPMTILSRNLTSIILNTGKVRNT